MTANELRGIEIYLTAIGLALFRRLIAFFEERVFGNSGIDFVLERY